MGAANSHSFDVGEQHENVKHVKMSDVVCESHHVPFHNIYSQNSGEVKTLQNTFHSYFVIQ